MSGSLTWRLKAVLLTVLVLATPCLAQKRPVGLDNIGGGGERASFMGQSPARWAPDGATLEIREGGKRVYLDPSTLAEVEAPASRPRKNAAGREPDPRKLEYEVSPDGALAAYVSRDRGGAQNLVVEVLEGGMKPEPWHVTEAVDPNHLFGRLDWVYQEEVYGRGNFKGFWWAPGSRHIAFLGLDQTQVKEFEYIDHLPAPLDRDKTVKVERMKYPKAGDPNPTVSLWIADIEAGKKTQVELEGYDPDILIVRVGWDPAGAVVAQIQNRIQTWLDLVRIDPRSGAVTRILREESKAWVEIIGEPHWLKDGSFLWLSDRTGFRHVYRYAPSGEMVGALTSGEWAVRELDHVDEDGGWITFTATKDGAVGSHLYRAPLTAGTAAGEVVCLTEGRGTHSTSYNADRTFFIDSVSHLGAPPSQTLRRADGTKVKDLGSATVPGLSTFEYVYPQLFEVPARDGFKLDAVVIEPLGLKPDGRHPVWLEIYAGPDTPSVRDAWLASGWFQFLAAQGVFVFQVNVRSASGKGFATTASCYRQFGVQELMDIEDSVKWLCGRYAQADPARVGIMGWSYGGFMAAYALTHSKAFRLGVAGAGVYDWRLYDTIYTERYMDTPANNPAGYAKSSCIDAAADLHGHLVLLHGTLDDNVHVQNTIRFAFELQRADKPFEMMLYPKSQHGIVNPSQRWHMQQLIWRAIETHLLH